MKSESITALAQYIDENGYALIEHVISPERAAALAMQLSSSLQTDQQQGAPLASRGTVYAARNPLEVIDDVAALWKQTPLGPFLREILGPEFGLVRGLFFDKPPGRSWWLPWHKDLTIAVQNNQLPSERFKSPTNKAGVPHVIAPAEVLQQMLTIRLHLDDVTLENGPLRVIPGSHRSPAEIDSCREPATILAQAGDALAMRPMLSHASGDSSPETKLHRRILHLEFAAQETLPDGYAWQRFVR
jgi:ectoine hydroxylase-related dioxygenase (phytanoyl-CoA dioxygenase family)